MTESGRESVEAFSWLHFKVLQSAIYEVQGFIIRLQFESTQVLGKLAFAIVL